MSKDVIFNEAEFPYLTLQSEYSLTPSTNKPNHSTPLHINSNSQEPSTNQSHPVCSNEVVPEPPNINHNSQHDSYMPITPNQTG